MFGMNGYQFDVRSSGCKYVVTVGEIEYVANDEKEVHDFMNKFAHDKAFADEYEFEYGQEHLLSVFRALFEDEGVRQCMVSFDAENLLVVFDTTIIGHEGETIRSEHREYPVDYRSDLELIREGLVKRCEYK